jgi:site-specific recombinase XerD
MKHSTEDQIANYLNRFVVPRDLKINRMIKSNQTDKNGEAMVYIRLRRYDPVSRKDAKVKQLRTEIRVNPKHWSSKRGEVLKGDFDYQQKNRIIKEKESRISNYINNPNLDYKMAQLSKEEFLLIEDVFPSKKLLKYKKSFVDYIEEVYERRKKLGQPHGTIKEFKTVMNRIKRFDDSKNKKTYLPDINISWSDDFEVWLNQEGYSKGTVEKTYTVLITVLYYYWEIKDEKNIEMTDKFTSKLFKRGDKSKNKPNPITEEQLMFLYNHTFKEKNLETVKKMILLQCFIGMRYDDIKRIRPENINHNFLIFTPKKTERHHIEVEQPLNPYSKALLEEVNYDTSCYKLTNQAYNREIEELLILLATKEEYKDLKFKTDHTSHNFRDTFISLAVTKGVNWKSILKWVGQSSYSIMDRYIHLTKPFEESEMKKMFI